MFPGLSRSALVAASELLAVHVLVRGWGGWGVARTGGGFPRPVCPSLTGTTGPYLGCLVSQPPRPLTIPEPHQGASGREIPPCLYISGRGGGGHSKCGIGAFEGTFARRARHQNHCSGHPS